MSTLPDSNGDVARSMLGRARAAHRAASLAADSEDTADLELACRNFVHAAELALKAVYVKHGRAFRRTHDIYRLYERCPDPSLNTASGQYTERELTDFADWYFAPYALDVDEPVNAADVEMCRRISTSILQRALAVIEQN